MIKKTSRQAHERRVRKWAKKHKDKIFEKFGNKCKNCQKEDDLSIHHIEYKIGYEYIVVWCNKCHRKHHNQEFKKQVLVLILKDVKKHQNLSSFSAYIQDLQQRIDQIPIELRKGFTIDGF